MISKKYDLERKDFFFEIKNRKIKSLNGQKWREDFDENRTESLEGWNKNYQQGTMNCWTRGLILDERKKKDQSEMQQNFLNKKNF